MWTLRFTAQLNTKRDSNRRLYSATSIRSRHGLLVFTIVTFKQFPNFQNRFYRCVWDHIRGEELLALNWKHKSEQSECKVPKDCFYKLKPNTVFSSFAENIADLIDRAFGIFSRIRHLGQHTIDLHPKNGLFENQ